MRCGGGAGGAGAGAGAIDGKSVPAYISELPDADSSSTETFVALKAEVQTWRWAGVPFYLRTGKRLPSRVSEIVIQFRDGSSMVATNWRHASPTWRRTTSAVHC